MLCIGTIVLHGVFFIICVVVTLTQCYPLEKLWDFNAALQGRCMDTTAFVYGMSIPNPRYADWVSLTRANKDARLLASAGFNILTNIWIICLPIPTLCAMEWQRMEKVTLCFIFGIGAFATVCSVGRVHSIYVFKQSEDPVHDGIPQQLWSLVELCVAISGASILVLKAFFSRSSRPDCLGGSRAERLGSQSSSAPVWKPEATQKVISSMADYKQRSWFDNNKMFRSTDTVNLEINMQDNEGERESTDVPRPAQEQEKPSEERPSQEVSAHGPPVLLFLAPQHIEGDSPRPSSEGVDNSKGKEPDYLEDTLPFPPRGSAISSRRSSFGNENQNPLSQPRQLV